MKADAGVTLRSSRLGMALVVGFVGLLVGGLLTLRSYSGLENNISGFLAFGQEEPLNAHASELLGIRVYERSTLGHDGKFFFLQALDPFYLDGEHAEFLDRPIYRGQRMLYPTIAGGFGLLPVTAVPWSMVLLNVAWLGVGAWGLARVAVRMGASPWWGLAFTLNPGLIAEWAISGAGVMAFGLAVWAFDALESDRPGVATALLTGAVLTREVFLLAVAGLVYLGWRRTGRWSWTMAAVPIGAAALWALYLRLRLVESSLSGEIQEIGIPLVGLFEALPHWLDRPFDLLVAVAALGAVGVMIARTWRSDHALAWGTVGFALLAVVLTEQVWMRYFDLARALAPVLTAFAVVVGSRRLPHRVL